MRIIFFAGKGGVGKTKDVELNKLFDELIVRIGSFKRHILLPKQVAAFDTVKAKLDGQYLNIFFKGESHAQ